MKSDILIKLAFSDSLGMREGLRSSSKLVGRNEEVEVIADCDVNDLETEELIDIVSEQRSLVSNLNEGAKVDKRDGLSDGLHCGGNDIGEGNAVHFSNNIRKELGSSSNREAERTVDGKMQSVCKVLRSRTVVKTDNAKKVDKVGKSFVSAGRRVNRSDGSEKRRVKMEIEERDHFYDSSRDQNQSLGEENDQIDAVVSEKPKCNRGSPPKAPEGDRHGKRSVEVETKERDESIGRDSNRLDRKAQAKQRMRRGKRGRPPKALKSDGSGVKRIKVDKDSSHRYLEETHEPCEKMMKKMKLTCGRPPMLDKGQYYCNQRKRKMGKGSRNRLIEKEPKMNNLAPDKIKYSNDEKVLNKQKAGGKRHKRSVRQVVRDKIVELLLGAGWSIEYRPRNGRDYYDAVYVNPEGRTHWSVTLAYRVLKEQFENVGENSNTCKADFKFIPLPDEELNLLTKVISKERSDKNKKKKEWKQEKRDLKLSEGVIKKKKRNKKVHKRKSNAAGSPGSKKLKGRKKLNTSLGDATGLIDDGTSVSCRGRRRLGTHGRKQFALMVRNPKDNMESDDGYLLYDGKRTVLTWMMDLGTLSLDGKLQYLKHQNTQALLEGRVTMDGIRCDCCSETFTISGFEIHAGSKSCQILSNIYLDSRSSLLECLHETWKKQDASVCQGFHFVDTDGKDPNDDTCGICGDGGDLICCDGCPSTFHQSCLEINMFPSGIWRCMYCSCKFCGLVVGNSCHGDEDIATEVPVLSTCSLCEEKYHQFCIQEKDVTKGDPSDPSYCGKECLEIHKKLQTLLGVKHEMEEGFSCTLIRRFDVVADTSLTEMASKVDCNSKVAVASYIMDECFLPMVDHRSGVNLIRNIVYNFGSNFNRLNYSGFLTAILERGDEMISAASIRIHGKHLAEMPFIGTRYMYRRQGMCRRLLTGIESALSKLGVRKLVIPAISELRETWTSAFGFRPLERSSKEKMRNMNMMVFPGVDMLQKPLMVDQLAKGCLKHIENQEKQNMEAMTNGDSEGCSAENGFKGSGDIEMHEAGKIIGESVALESRLRLLNDAPNITLENANSYTCHSDRKCLNQSGVLPSHMEVRIKSNGSSMDVCDDNQQIGQVDKTKNGISGAPDNIMAELLVQSSHCNISEVESKSCVISGAISEAAKSEVQMEGSNLNEDSTSLDQNSVQDLTVEHLGKLMDSTAEAKTKTISSVVYDPKVVTAKQRAEDVSDYCNVLTTDHNGTGPAVLARASNLSLSTSAGASSSSKQSCMNCGHRASTDIVSPSCGVVSCESELKRSCDKANDDRDCPDVISEMSLMHNNYPIQNGSDSGDNHASATQSRSESLCSSSSVPNVMLQCASGSGNSCDTPEAIILSNKAS
ncbi:hypothetical protein K2173_018495 [Erythroxylum novogranatense]|uniref:PHD-type domain-containing protein n=1 Tax=Erythroxylum novogranatense TaxID=1862640 RepID=A0AAV8UDH3_9ROSI|nr:hypothetical protein K2173_018495 [Erythroxylum novogranatense]